MCDTELDLLQIEAELPFTGEVPTLSIVDRKDEDKQTQFPLSDSSKAFLSDTHTLMMLEP